MDLQKFDAHRALPEDLAHAIFERINGLINEMSTRVPLQTKLQLHEQANTVSRELQQLVADHVADLTWKLTQRRGPVVLGGPTFGAGGGAGGISSPEDWRCGK